MRILLVEDDSSLSDSLATAIRSLKHHLHVTAEAKTALAELEQRPFDAVVTDLHLPGMSGLELLKIARERGIEFPFILTTGHVDPQVAAELQGLGVAAFMRKPFSLEQIESALSACSRESTKCRSAQDQRFREEIARIMKLCVNCWELSTGKPAGALAHESRAWKISSGGRARAFERYLNLNTLPSIPKLDPVLKTARFVLEQASSSQVQEELRIALSRLEHRDPQAPDIPQLPLRGADLP
jgi:CheY-like chemotaxis protein